MTRLASGQRVQRDPQQERVVRGERLLDVNLLLACGWETRARHSETVALALTAPIPRAS